MTHDGPLILGANGRIGRMFRHLHSAGLWPGERTPIWVARRGETDLDWPHGGLAGRKPRGMIVLAGVTEATGADENIAIAREAIAWAEAHAIAPVLLCSSVAVYGAGGADLTEAQAHPSTAYGCAKHRMEQCAGPDVCSLRIANVIGADSLSRRIEDGTASLASLPDGGSPLRSYIGPVGLARVMLGLIEAHHRARTLPTVVNVAMQHPCTLADLARAVADLPVADTPTTAPPVVTVNTDVLAALLPNVSLSTGIDDMVQEARDAGWSPR